MEANKDLLHDDILMPQGTQRSSINNVDALWPSPVPYVLDQSLEMNAKGVVLKALDQFRLKSCIDFKPRDSEEYYISVQKDDGCYSYIGRVLPNGQVLSIGHYCDDLSIAEHEFLHALGFFHEQSRYDRDDYVTIVPENIIEGFERNFRKASAEDSTTHGVPYDYWSVMHYGADFFSNGNGSTIITKDPKFQNVIGQRLEVSSSDVRELNLLYRCNSTIAFKMYCGFTNGTMCQMDRCSRSDIEWEMTTHIASGPMSDHTGGSEHGQDERYFMHASTTLGKEGDSATLQTKRMRPSRDCHIQCLQFYYYHNGNESDELNIWIREFQDEHDFTGKVRLMGQITGPPTSHWQLQHVSLDATKHFQVEFVVRKGAGSSVGGFSIDDINLSEIECPHVTLQINDFEKLLNTSYYGTTIYSPRQYSRGGYAYRVGAILYETFFGVFVQLLSGKYDDELEWPCPHRQVTFQIRDQNPNIQLQMSKQKSITSDPSATNDDGTYVWDDPRKNGTQFVDENNETVYASKLIGRHYLASLEDIQYRDFLKGGSAIFVFSFQDLTPLINGSALPCPEVGSVKLRHLRKEQDDGPCSPQIATTTPPNPETRDPSIFGFSPAMVSSPVLTLLPALMLLAR
ncbi:meprin A subunit beta-like [Thunnus thynnus]|uniref:meprin A subunit beta-like n=1 Tax=Thunnus thynnus TaxID=8237 RepID=UPI003527202C